MGISDRGRRDRRKRETEGTSPLASSACPPFSQTPSIPASSWTGPAAECRQKEEVGPGDLDDYRGTRLPRPVRPLPDPTSSAARLSKQSGPSQDREALCLGLVRPTDASTRHYRGCADPLLELHAARDARRMRLSEE